MRPASFNNFLEILSYLCSVFRNCNFECFSDWERTVQDRHHIFSNDSKNMLMPSPININTNSFKIPENILGNNATNDWSPHFETHSPIWRIALFYTKSTAKISRIRHLLANNSCGTKRNIPVGIYAWQKRNMFVSSGEICFCPLSRRTVSDEDISGARRSLQKLSLEWVVFCISNTSAYRKVFVWSALEPSESEHRQKIWILRLRACKVWKMYTVCAFMQNIRL